MTGGYDFRIYWLQEAFNALLYQPEIEAVIFFHSSDTEGAWGDIATPDWRKDPNVITGFIDWMKDLDS